MSKKASKLYLTVAFFFILFSFGKSASATVYYSQPVFSTNATYSVTAPDGSDYDNYGSVGSNSFSAPGITMGSTTKAYVKIQLQDTITHFGAIYLYLMTNGGSSKCVLQMSSGNKMDAVAVYPAYFDAILTPITPSTCDPSSAQKAVLYVGGAYPGTVNMQGNGTIPYLILTDDAGIDPVDNRTRVISLNPNATTTASTTVSLTGSYYNNDSDDEVVSATLNVTNRQPPYASYQWTFPTNASGVNSISTSTTLVAGDYSSILTLNFASSSSPSIETITLSYMIASFSVIEQVEAQYFSFATSTTLAQLKTDCSLETDVLPRITCYIVDRFNGLLQYLFVPSPQTVNLFSSLNTQLSTRFPFAYVYDMNEMRTELFSATQTATTTVGVNVNHFGQITFLSKPLLESVPYATTVRTIIGYLMWLMAVEYIYLRVLKSHDNHTPS